MMAILVGLKFFHAKTRDFGAETQDLVCLGFGDNRSLEQYRT